MSEIANGKLRAAQDDNRKPILPQMIAAHVIAMAAVLGINIIVPFELSVLIDIIVLVLAPIATAISTGYLLRLFRADTKRPRSELFAFLSYGSLVITIGLVVIGVFAVVRVLHDVYGTPFFSTEITTTGISTAFMLCASVPVMKALLFRSFNRDRGDDEQIPPIRHGI